MLSDGTSSARIDAHARLRRTQFTDTRLAAHSSRQSARATAASTSANFDRVVMLLGASRSGTSWLGKIFDSHPDVLYRHEPDLVSWEPRLPFLVPESEVDSHVAVAADYAARLLNTATLKSSGQLPMFPKAYYAPGIQPMRAALIRALRCIAAISGSRRMRSCPVPDLFNPARHANLRIVLKSVSARGRTGVFLRALPGLRVVFLLRHPCGQVASTLRGLAQGRFDTGVFIRDALAVPAARRYGLTERRLNAASAVEQLAWHWVTMNELAMDAMAGTENTRTVVYEDLCHDPIGEVRNLFAFGRLDWGRQTEDFIRRSISQHDGERYYGVFRDPVIAANQWRTELSEHDQRRVRAVVAGTSLAGFWADI